MQRNYKFFDHNDYISHQQEIVIVYDISLQEWTKCKIITNRYTRCYNFNVKKSTPLECNFFFLIPETPSII